MRAIFAFCRVLLPLILVVGVAPAAEQSPVAAKINAALERYAADLSGVVLVAERGVPVFEHAYGLRNVAAAKPITPDSIFELASLSKQFTAMSLMMLKEQGKLDYDDALEKYIPGLPYPGMTIRQRLRRRRVLDAVRMARKVRAVRSDIEAMRVTAAIEGLRRQRMGDGD